MLPGAGCRFSAVTEWPSFGVAELPASVRLCRWSSQSTCAARHFLGAWTAVGHARLLLTCGLPGAGKTTRARKLAADRGALRLTQDEWLIALGSMPWDESTREKLDQGLWRLAQEVLVLGLSVIVDFGLWARIERDEMRLAARRLGVGVELHYVDVPVDELWRQNHASKRGTLSRPGTATRLAATTCTSASAFFKRPMPQRWRCSTRCHAPQAEPSGAKPGSRQRSPVRQKEAAQIGGVDLSRLAASSPHDRSARPMVPPAPDRRGAEYPSESRRWRALGPAIFGDALEALVGGSR